MGAHVAILGAVGDDGFGRQLLASARRDRVDLRCVLRRQGPSGLALILIDSKGENSIAVAAGANATVSASDVTAASDAFEASDVVLAELELPLETVRAVGRSASRARKPFILNAAPAPATKLDRLLADVTILVVNETELAALTGADVERGKEEGAARRLLAWGPKAVIVTLGARGALLVRSEGSSVVKSPKVTVVDSTAAGDAFAGALAAAYRGLDSLPEAVARGCAAGALACTRRGAQPSLPTRAEVEALLQS